MAKDVTKVTSFPPILSIKRTELEKLFKFILKKIVSENKLENKDLQSMNKELVKWIITGMQNVDFNKDVQNQKALDSLIDDVWKDFYRIFNLKMRKHRMSFRRK